MPGATDTIVNEHFEPISNEASAPSAILSGALTAEKGFHMYTLASQPQGIGRNLDNGFRLFAAGIKGAIGIMLIMIGSGIVLGIILALVLGAAFVPLMNIGTGQTPEFGMSTILTFLLVGLAASLFFTYFMNALILNYANIGYQGTGGIGKSLSGAFSRLMPAYGALILMMLFLIILALPGIVYQFSSMQKLQTGEISELAFFLIKFVIDIPYYFLAVTLSFTVYRAVIDEYGPLSAVIGSHKLVWGNFWRTVLWVVIVYFIIAVLFFAIFIPTFGSAAFFGQGGDTDMAASAGIIGALLMFIFMMFVFPFFVSMFIPYYNDLKLRKEGGDLAARISAA